MTFHGLLQYIDSNSTVTYPTPDIAGLMGHTNNPTTKPLLVAEGTIAGPDQLETKFSDQGVT